MSYPFRSNPLTIACAFGALRAFCALGALGVFGAVIVCDGGCSKDGADEDAAVTESSSEARASDAAPPVAVTPAPTVRVPEPVGFDAFHPASADHIRAMIAAVRATPDDLDAWTRLGMVYHANELRDLAAPCYEYVIERAPNAARPLYYAALLEYDRGNVEPALGYLHRARQAEPAYVSGHTRAGDWYAVEGDFESARAAYEQVIPLAPHDPSANRGLARLDIQERRWTDAIDRLNAYLEHVPNDTTAQFLLASAYRGNGDPDAAAAAAPADASVGIIDEHDAWHAEIMLERRGFRPLLNRASQLIQADRIDEALSILEELRATAPDEPLVLINLHQAYRKLHRTDEALVLLERALELVPRYHMLRLYLAGTLLELAGQAENPGARSAHLDRALEHAEAANEIRPTFVFGHIMRADVLGAMGRADEAAEAMLRAADIERSNASYYRTAALKLVETEQWTPAIRALRRLDELEPDNVFTLYMLGSALANAGDREAGLEILLRAQTLAPNETRIADALRRLDETLDDTPDDTAGEPSP
jgi:tetratricopeptide (TPR) repeat protein